MKIRCNEQEAQIEGNTLAAALIELGYQGTTVATAINGEFVPKTQRNDTILNAGDQLDILAPMQGG